MHVLIEVFCVHSLYALCSARVHKLQLSLGCIDLLLLLLQACMQSSMVNNYIHGQCAWGGCNHHRGINTLVFLFSIAILILHMIFIGPCAQQGFTTCCNLSISLFCAGVGGECYCDESCFTFGDCCSDVLEIGCTSKCYYVNTSLAKMFYCIVTYHNKLQVSIKRFLLYQLM